MNHGAKMCQVTSKSCNFWSFHRIPPTEVDALGRQLLEALRQIPVFRETGGFLVELDLSIWWLVISDRPLLDFIPRSFSPPTNPTIVVVALLESIFSGLIVPGWKKSALDPFQFQSLQPQENPIQNILCRRNDAQFFPRAFERSVLLIAGVCETFSHLHIFSSSHVFPSSHLHILTFSHLCIFTSSHLHVLSCSLALLLHHSFLFLFWGRGAVPTRRHEMQPFRTKWGSIAKNWSKIAISGFPSLPFRTIWSSIAKNWSKIAICKCPAQPFRTKWGSIAKNWVKLRFAKCPANPFARNEVRSPKTEVKLRFVSVQSQPFRTKWGSIAKNWSKIAICKVSGEPFRTKWGSIAKKWSKIAISRVRAQPFRAKWGSIAENWDKIAMSWVRSLCVKVFVCKSFCVRKFLSVKASVCESFCV